MCFQSAPIELFLFRLRGFLFGGLDKFTDIVSAFGAFLQQILQLRSQPGALTKYLLRYIAKLFELLGRHHGNLLMFPNLDRTGRVLYTFRAATRQEIASTGSIESDDRRADASDRASPPRSTTFWKFEQTRARVARRIKSKILTASSKVKKRLEQRRIVAHASVQDLTTDRLFRLLQNFSTTTPVLSISGSKMNRFTTGAGQIVRSATKLGLNLTVPHDLVVEDVSVDLSKSILPNEVIDHGNALYLHLRAYEGCTDVTHSSIHNNYVVADYIADFASHT
jgi:hypothetical protein